MPLWSRGWGLVPNDDCHRDPKHPSTSPLPKKYLDTNPRPAVWAALACTPHWERAVVSMPPGVRRISKGAAPVAQRQARTEALTSWVIHTHNSWDPSEARTSHSPHFNPSSCIPLHPFFPQASAPVTQPPSLHSYLSLLPSLPPGRKQGWRGCSKAEEGAPTLQLPSEWGGEDRPLEGRRHQREKGQVVTHRAQGC